MHTEFRELQQISCANAQSRVWRGLEALIWLQFHSNVDRNAYLQILVNVESLL